MARFASAATASTRKSIYWSGDWLGAVCWNTASATRRGGKDQVVIEPQIPDYWPQTPGLDNTDVDRAVAICLSAAPRQRDGAGIAARRRVVQDLRSEDRGRPRYALAAAADQKIPAAGRLSGDRTSGVAGGLPDPFQDRGSRRRRPARHPKATTISCCGIFTICCFTPTAPKAGKPIRWAGFIPMPASCRRCPRCGRPGPERKSICASSARRLRRPPRRSQSSCVNVIRCATSTTSSRSRWPNSPRFLDGAARVQSKWKSRIDLGGGGPMVSYAARPYPSGGSAYELELYLAVANCEGLGARILSLRRRPSRAGADRRARARNSTRSWRPPNLPWMRPARPRS